MPSFNHQATFIQIADLKIAYKSIFLFIVLANNTDPTINGNKASNATVL